MKEIIYKFDNRGGYLPNNAVGFDGEDCLRLVIEPHDFELEISGEVLRKSSCKGYAIEVSSKGAVRFFDWENNLLADVNETEREFSQVLFTWKQDKLTLTAGYTATVDYYPDCDGEYDRWGKEWVAEYEVTLDTQTNKAEAFVR